MTSSLEIPEPNIILCDQLRREQKKILTKILEDSFLNAQIR